MADEIKNNKLVDVLAISDNDFYGVIKAYEYATKPPLLSFGDVVICLNEGVYINYVTLLM